MTVPHIMVFPVVTLGLLLLLSKLSAGDFSYDGNHGPSHWSEEYQACSGRYQSPIDIEEKDVINTTFPPLQFNGLDKPHSIYIKNNGHTAMVETTEPEPVSISGGPLNDTYIFLQLHFHWGPNDKIGSEDLINNHSFSMELHAVFYKKSYGTSVEAMKHPDGLTVLGYLYEAETDTNPAFTPIIKTLSNITTVGANSTIPDPMLLTKLIAPNLSSPGSYYTYKGSLTTPPCLEIVTWIDFTEALPISHDQIAAFRNIKSNDGSTLTNNVRPVQPLDGRVIYRNDPIADLEDSSDNDELNEVNPEGNKNSGQEGSVKLSSVTTLCGACAILLGKF